MAEVSIALNKIIMRACSFERSERYQTAEEFRKALISIVSADVIGECKYNSM